MVTGPGALYGGFGEIFTVYTCDCITDLVSKGLGLCLSQWDLDLENGSSGNCTGGHGNYQGNLS